MPAYEVLVVDDDAVIRETLSLALELEGHAVQTACNGRYALQQVEHATPALVLLDLWMPVLDGWGFVAAMRSRALQIPILLMSAAREGPQVARELGVQGFLPKPFDINQLLTEVARLCGAVPADGPLASASRSPQIPAGSIASTG